MPLRPLDDLFAEYETELVNAVAERDRRAATPGTVEYAQEQRVVAERARRAELMATAEDDDDDDDLDDAADDNDDDDNDDDDL